MPENVAGMIDVYAQDFCFIIVHKLSINLYNYTRLCNKKKGCLYDSLK